ncbi:MAG: ATP-binding cassette domain-containing protein [Desulfobacter sp.]|nr:MAG: ATP-binding cassette domain-containing protein [Desulfobacter sp.]
MAEPFIQLIGIRKRFGDNSVLNGVDLSIHRGQITTVIGKSGTGKSVLLKHIIGLMKQDEGQLLVNGVPLDRMDKAARHGFRREISYMFQDNALFDFLSIYENIALPLSEKKILPEREIRAKVLEKMEMLGIQGIEESFPSQLSGGMRKRVALARALITDPAAVLFDEPTTGLDPVRRNNVHGMISRYQKEFGFTAVIVSHDIPEIFEITQHIAMLDKGKIIFEGSTEAILASENDTVNAFIRGKEM